VNVFTQGDFVSYTWPDLLYQLKEGTKQSMTRNLPLWIMVGGIMVYSLMMVVLVNIIA
jgi:branched-subunit amino acid transport protein